MGGDWRDGFQWAHQLPESEPEGPGLVWREFSPDHWSGSWGSQLRGTVMYERATDQWVGWLRLEDPPGVSPITDVGWFGTADEAMIAVDEVWAAR